MYNLILTKCPNFHNTYHSNNILGHTLCTQQPDSIPNNELLLVMRCTDQIIISECYITQIQGDKSCAHLTDAEVIIEKRLMYYHG